MGILKDRFFIILIFLGLIIRVLLMSLPGFYVDVNDWFGWAFRLNEVGFSKFYSDQVFSDYAPGYLYVLSILGFLKNLLVIDDRVFHLLLKIPAILAEITLSIFIYKDMVKSSSIFYGRLTACLILFNPAFIFNSAVWGQIDGILALFLYLSIYFLRLNRLAFSSVLIGISLLIKPQAVAVLPVFLLFLMRNLSIKNFIQLTLPSLSVIFIMSLPFFTNKPFIELFSQIIKAANIYPYNSLFAFNFWGGMGFWIPDNFLFFSLSYRMWGYILLIIFWFWVFIFGRKKLSLNILAALATLSFFFLPTRIHERYLYPALVFLIIVASQIKSRVLLTLTIVLSLIHFLNLYYVYVYYNEFYFKMPKLLYNPILYNFLDIYGREISIFSTVIFILISVIIIRYSNVNNFKSSKKN